MTKEYLLEDFIKELNFEDIKKNHVGDDFRIDFNYDDSIICWFDPTGDHKSFDCIEITEDMDKFDFEWEVKKIQDVIKELEDIQKNLTIKAEDYRRIFLDYVNDHLSDYNLKPIKMFKYKGEFTDTTPSIFLKDTTIKKYKNIDELEKEIIKNNADNPNLEDFLDEYAWEDDMAISLVHEKDGSYFTLDDYQDKGDVIDVVYAPINQILSTDDVIYKPDLSACKDIYDEFKYKSRSYDDWER